MTLEFFLLFTLGAAAGGFINGLAGFGTALFTLGFWLQIMPPIQSVSMVVIISVVSGLQGVWIVRHSILANPRRLARFLVPALIGIPIGIATLSIIDPKMLKLAIAAILILYGGYFFLRGSLPAFDRATPLADNLIGFFGGVLGGAASLSGALPTIWCSLRPWSKAETRAILQPFNVVVLSLSAVILAFKGVYDRHNLLLLAIALPTTMVFAQFGIEVYKRIRDDQFRWLIITMTFVAGVILVLRELL